MRLPIPEMSSKGTESKGSGKSLGRQMVVPLVYPSLPAILASW